MIKRLTFLLVWVSLAVSIFYFFYLFGLESLTRIFLPLPFVAIMVSLIHGPVTSVLVAIFTVIFSSLATGLPSVEFFVPTIVESSVSGLVATFFYRKTASLYLTVLLAYMTSKVLLVVAVYSLHIGLKVSMDLLMGLVGLGLQLIFIPMIYKVLVKSSKIEKQKGGI